MKKQVLLTAFALLLVSGLLTPLPAQTNPGTKPLTIEAIFSPGGLGGRGPENCGVEP